MHSLLQRQEELHEEGKQLLDSVIIPIMQEYGNVLVGGSYAYNLLTYPDIDIDVVTENVSRDIYVELCAKIISHTGVSKFKTTDRVAYPSKHPGIRPKGYWLSPEIHFGKNVWTLDIWFQKPEWHTSATYILGDQLNKLDNEKRLTILTLKDELRSMGLYGLGKEFQSVDVYEAILHADIKTIDDLRRYKESAVS